MFFSVFNLWQQLEICVGFVFSYRFSIKNVQLPKLRFGFSNDLKSLQVTGPQDELTHGTFHEYLIMPYACFRRLVLCFDCWIVALSSFSSVYFTTKKAFQCEKRERFQFVFAVVRELPDRKTSKLHLKASLIGWRIVTSEYIPSKYSASLFSFLSPLFFFFRHHP